MSTIIKALQAAVPQGQVVIGRPEVRALRMYANNKKRNPVAPIEKFLREVRETGPWPLAPQFLSDSLPWLKDIIIKKNGLLRTTRQSLRLNTRELHIVRDLDTILFVGVTVLDFWKETKLTYAVFRAVDKAGDSFDFYFVPWQFSDDQSRTGLFPVNSNTEVL